MKDYIITNILYPISLVILFSIYILMICFGLYALSIGDISKVLTCTLLVGLATPNVIKIAKGIRKQSLNQIN